MLQNCLVILVIVCKAQAGADADDDQRQSDVLLYRSGRSWILSVLHWSLQ